MINEVDLQQIIDGCPLQKQRMQAWSQFLQKGLPTRKNESYRYVKVGTLTEGTYPLANSSIPALDPSWIAPECRGSFLLFVNGRFVQELSQIEALPDSIVIDNLGNASLTYGAFLRGRMEKSIREENDPFALLNQACHRDGLFVYLPPKSKCSQPIQIVHLVTEEGLSLPRLFLFAGAHAEAEILLASKPLAGSYAINQTTELHLEEGAALSLQQVAIEDSPQGWHLSALRAGLKKNSRLRLAHITKGSKTTRFDYHIRLQEENSEALINGLSALARKQEAHTHICIEHQAPHCRSHQNVKNILRDASHSSFEGKIYVHQEAQKTEAYQLNHNLLLSEEAHAESKPNLEIFADDVKASHGSTFGTLDEEQIFYLLSRGFTKEAAEKIVIAGHCEEILESITLPTIQCQLRQAVQ